MRLIQVILLATVLIGCAAPTPTSIKVVSTPSSDTSAFFRRLESTTEIAILMTGYFDNGVFRFQDVVGDHIVTCWVVDGYESIAIECLELD